MPDPVASVSPVFGMAVLHLTPSKGHGGGHLEGKEGT